MAEIDRILRAPTPDDPNRCQGITNHGQCLMLSIEGLKFCPLHAASANNTDVKKVRNYRLSKWQSRMEELAGSEEVKSLREEIGILRMVLEETINKCSDTTDLILYSNKISDLVLKIEKLVSSCHRLEQSTGLLMDKTAALHLAGSIVDIIGNHIDDSHILETIGDAITTAIIQVQVKKND